MTSELPARTSYGSGVFRRRIRLIAAADSVRTALEDGTHSMRLVLRHDGTRIAGFDPEFLRIPVDTCPGAIEPLRKLIGTPLATPLRAVLAAHDPRLQCTHLHDLALLAMAHASRRGTRQYDIEVPDEHPGAVWSRVLRDGSEVHRWQTFHGRILAPEPFAGLPMLRGFAAWASERFAADADALEAALILHKGYLVSSSRRYDMSSKIGQPVQQFTLMHGACYTYSPEIVGRGIWLSRVRDFTHCADDLLAGFE